MPIWEAILLGVIQGITEFLPISSTAHLLAVRELLGHKNKDDAFTVVIQLGTLLAVFVYFRADIAKLLLGLWSDIRSMKVASTPDSRLGWLIVLGSIPVGVIGLLFKKKIKETFYDLPSMGVVAILFAVLMFASEFWHRIRSKDRHLPEIEESKIGWKEALWIGVWQTLALMPGASRSGTTITGALFAGLTRSAAARFSFLLSLPSILAAGVKELYDEYKQYKTPDPEKPVSLFASTDDITSLIVGTLVSAIVGYIAIAWLLNYLRKYSMNAFVIYRIILGLAILGWVFAKR